MKDQTIAKNISRIRNLQEISQTELAKQVGISRQALSNIEKGSSIPKATTLQKIAQALNVGIQELVIPVRELKWVRFRSEKNLKNREKILHQVSLWLENFNQLERWLNDSIPYQLADIAEHLRAKKSRPRAIEAAQKVREKLKISPSEPIRDIYGLLESAGIKIYMLSLANDSFFGLSVAQEDGGPAIIVNTWKRISVERWIFTTAHELGHLILHSEAYDVEERAEPANEEKEANLFASYFLMPSDMFKQEWDATYGMIFIERVLKLKRLFHVSYKTVLYRLHEEEYLEINVWNKFNEQYQRIYGEKLFRTDEPIPLKSSDFYNSFAEALRSKEPENLSPHDFIGNRFKKLVRLAVEQKIITLSKAAELLQISLSEMRDLAADWV